MAASTDFPFYDTTTTPEQDRKAARALAHVAARLGDHDGLVRALTALDLVGVLVGVPTPLAPVADRKVQRRDSRGWCIPHA